MLIHLFNVHMHPELIFYKCDNFRAKVKSKITANRNSSEYKFKCWLTKDSSETSSLEYKIKTNCTVNFPLSYQHMFLCVNGLTHFNWVVNGKFSFYF